MSARSCACGCGDSLAGMRSDALYRSEACRKRHERASSADKGRVRDRARQRVAAAIEQGVLTRADHCESCGRAADPRLRKPNIEAHHADYSKPLEVEWLCLSCHRTRHAEERRNRRKVRDGLGVKLYIQGDELVLVARALDRLGLMPTPEGDRFKAKLLRAADRIAERTA